jgi:hypothetical protein
MLKMAGVKKITDNEFENLKKLITDKGDVS